MQAQFELPANHRDLYLQFASVAKLHEKLFPGRGADDTEELVHSRFEVPLGWIGPALKNTRRCPTSLKHFFRENKTLCQNTFQTLSLDAQLARKELVHQTGLQQIQEYLCHASLGIVKPGAPPQQFHPDWDHDGPPFSHWTLALNLTNIPNQGTTEFGSTSDSCTLYQGSYIWQGHAVHRGGANLSEDTRVILFLIFLHTAHPKANPDKDDNNPHNNAIPP
jgi:hypothetical protein